MQKELEKESISFAEFLADNRWYRSGKTIAIIYPKGKRPQLPYPKNEKL